MRTLTYYYSKKSNDSLDIFLQLKELCDSKHIPIVDICIDEDKDLEERFSGKTPAILIGPYHIHNPFTLREVEVAINATKGLDSSNGESAVYPHDNDALSFSQMESFSLWFSRSYVWVISALIFVFVFFAFLPPILELNGKNNGAAVIYKVYSYLCHQLAYRSFFIGGEQFVYPRELAHVKGVLTYEEVTGTSSEDILFARSFIGNPVLGYKLALCERDIAIYVSLALFGIIFQITGKKIRPLPWYWWFLIALFPIALDGFSQLPSLAQGWPSWLPIRESTPFLRVLTGVLFGSGTAWYMYPLMEESMKVTRMNLSRKLSIIKKVNQSA